jgi:spoIIIJ-associated protein
MSEHDEHQSETAEAAETVEAQEPETTAVEADQGVAATVAVEAVADDESEEAEDDSADSPESDQTGRSATVRRLMEEGEVAADYLEELLDIADLDGDIDIDVDHGRASVAIVTDESGQGSVSRLVGADGEVLEALQELTRIAVQARTGDRSRLMLDIAGWRADRRADVEKVAARAISEVQERNVNVSLEPMNAFERKVVHDAVASAGLVSESSGAEPDRFVVIRPL